MNHRTQWLFPGTRAGHHIAEQALMQRLRGLGIDIHAARAAAPMATYPAINRPQPR
jgi:hypothetical protein